MIDTEIENMEKDMESRLGYQGMKLDDYLQMIGKTRQEFRDEYKPQAEKQIKSRLVLEAVANDAKIEVTEEEISSKIAEMAKMYGQKEEDVKNNEQLINYVKENLKTEKNKNKVETCKFRKFRPFIFLVTSSTCCTGGWGCGTAAKGSFPKFCR